jgi:nicotinamidase-related amidase
MKNDGLILIDLQNDYFPGGRMELAGIVEAAANAQMLLYEFRKTESTVIHIQHNSTRPGATFFLPETEGAKINPMVAPRENEIIVVKNFPNSFRNTSLLEILKKQNIEKLFFSGAMSHMCIDATVRAAFDLGFNCVVAEDACSTMNLVFQGRTLKAADVHASFMAALSFPYSKVISTKEVIENIA